MKYGIGTSTDRINDKSLISTRSYKQANEQLKAGDVFIDYSRIKYMEASSMSIGFIPSVGV